MAAVDIMKHFNRSLFIAHREELIMQAYEEISQIYPMQVGIVKGNINEFDKKIVVASVQTLYNRLDKIHPEAFGYIAIDEVHHYASRTYLATARHFRPKLLTGWTATPKRLDGMSLSNLFQEMVFEYRIADGIRENYLAKIDAYQIQTAVELTGVKKVAGDFNQRELSERVDIPKRNQLIVEKYKQYAEGRQAIAFCVDIDHSYNLKQHFINAGISCESVNSNTERCPNRSEIIERFQNGEIDVLTNVEILTEGFDYSDVGCVIAARPTQSESLYVQTIGRGTRLKSDTFKERFPEGNCIILDFVDNTAKHSLVNSYSLEENVPLADKLFLPKEHKEMLMEAREKRIREMAVRNNKDLQVDLLMLPKVTIWNSEKMLEPATEKQIEWIKSLGLYQEDVEYTKMMASEVITNSPAKSWQVRWLQSQGYDVSGTVSNGQYQVAKKAYEMRNKFSID